jgi:hypothetical protein
MFPELNPVCIVVEVFDFPLAKYYLDFESICVVNAMFSLPY